MPTRMPNDGNALFSAFPALADRVPFSPLGRFPTRVHRLSGVLPPAVDLWVKRDDESGTAYGGNKVRKLEFLVADAVARKKSRLITMGGFGSHHVLATAVYGRAAGLEVDAVVFPQPITEHVKETVLAAASTGLTYHPVAGIPSVGPRVLALRARRGSVWIAAGGSSPVGSLGYVAAGLELAAQIAAGECPIPDVIYVALGSCGTAAGLLVGLRAAGITSRLVAVQVVDRVVCNRGATLRLAARTRRLIEKKLEKRLPIESGASGKPGIGDFIVDPRFFGGAYGLATDEATSAVAAAAASGLPLETTYTGKTFAALLADAQAGLLDGKRVLFFDTYSSVDLAPLLAAAPAPALLPPRLAKLFETP